MPPDFAACTELDIDRGFCVMTTSGRAGYVDSKHNIYDADTGQSYDWFSLRPLMVQIPYYDYVKLKAYIIKECRRTNECDKRISTWERSLDNIDSVIKNKLPLPAQ